MSIVYGEAMSHVASELSRVYEAKARDTKVDGRASAGFSKEVIFTLRLNHIRKLNNRGVAKVVSRQFRVLETVGSSPAASTKKQPKTSYF